MTKSNWNFFIFYSLVCCISIVSAKLNPNDKNVCSKLKRPNNYIKLRNECVFKARDYNKLLECIDGIDFDKLIEVFCCDGYEEIDNQCVPACDDCVHGTCVAPNTCKDCALGFGGLNCGESCNSTDRFGTNCEHDCKVILNPKLNNNFEFCDSCNSTDSMKSECKDICKCRHACPSGYYGKDCNLKCPSFKCGNTCLNDCKCEKNNTMTCNRVSGECKCKDSYYGEYCELWCDPKISNLTCTNPHNCTCEFNTEYKIYILKMEKIYHSDKGNFYQIAFGITFIVMIIVAILLLIHKYELTYTKKSSNAIKFKNDASGKSSSGVNIFA